MRILQLLTVFYLIATCPLAQAGGIAKIHPLYLEETASADFTAAVIRDADGFLWIATDNGLKRYNGYNLEVFNQDKNHISAIGSGAINALLVDSQGNLWAAGTNLNKFHPRTDSFSSYHLSENRVIRTLVESKNGHFWLGGEGFGLLEFDPASGEVMNQFFANTNRGFIRALYYQKETKTVWVASAEGLYLFDIEQQREQPIALPLQFGIGVESIRDMEEDTDGRMWIATVDGLFVLDQKHHIVKHYQADAGNPSGLSTNALWSVKRDRQGQLWIGTDKHGVHKYVPDTDTFIHYEASAYDPDHLPLGIIVDIYEDDRGTVWFAAGPFGVYRLSEQLEKFGSIQHSFDRENSLAFNNVLDLEEDAQGNVWIATDGGGLDCYEPLSQHFSHYRYDPDDKETLASNSVISLAIDKRGFVWAGTWGGGLNRLDPKTGKVERISNRPEMDYAHTLGNNNIFRIEIMPDGRLLLSVWRLGLQVYDPQTKTFEPYFPMGTAPNTGIHSFSIVDFLAVNNGEYLLGGYQGLERFSPRQKRGWPVDTTLLEPINDLHLDSDGFVWIATNKKLLRYNLATRSADFFGSEEGLPDEYIVSIEQDRLGFLWLGTRSGLARFDPNSLDVLSFDETDGLVGTKFNRFSHLKTGSGRMYFGSTEGISYFDPENLPRNEYSPKIHLTGLEIFQQPVRPGSELLTNTVDYTSELTLPNTSRDITIEFTALNFISPAKNRYRYRMLGWEDEWVEVDASRRRVRYTNLDAGTYKFQVLGSNNEGVWAGTVRELRLTILPAWWQTWWSRALYILLAICIMYGFSYWRLRSNRRRERELKLLVSEQTSQLKRANRSVVQLNSELEQRVAHRTRELQLEIEERRESEAKANYIAYHDALTNLYNRAWLLKHLDGLLKQLPDSEKRFALFFVGGDRFRRINDAHGHLLGDKLLIEVAVRLSNLIVKSGHCVRLGSDEFTVVLDEITSQDQVTAWAKEIIDTFSKPFVIEKIRINFSVSVGIVICDSSYVETSQVLRNANIAMQRAKDLGRGMYQMFDQDILRHTLEKVALEADLKLALKRNQLSVVYQPITVMATGTLSGFEVLMRWQHPERGMVPPDKFIAMAEASGLIFEMGLWVLETACNQLRNWSDMVQPNELPTIAVNISPLQLGQADLLQRIDAIFQKTGVTPEQIKLEITESALMKHIDTVDQLLESLRERGIELAIDDFGTGYSSLSYLDQLPVQVLKIDRAFVNALFDTSNEKSSAHEIVRATVSLAHNLKMRVVAEGIETQEQWDALRDYNCDYGQGYWIARPLSPEDATAFLQRATVELLPKL